MGSERLSWVFQRQLCGYACPLQLYNFGTSKASHANVVKMSSMIRMNAIDAYKVCLRYMHCLLQLREEIILLLPAQRLLLFC